MKPSFFAKLETLIAEARRLRSSGSGKVYIRAVLTHAEYDAGKWKEE
jgi:hypothetical protein